MPPSRRDELIDAAMRVFHRHGFHATCLDKVLEEAGISRMTIYNHFKSKDELILAALRRRHELFRTDMLRFIEATDGDAVARILAVFDFHEQWLTDRDFCGCMFINASAEFCDPRSPVRIAAADHKREILEYLVHQCALAKLADPDELGARLGLLLEGAIVTAHVVGQVGGRGASPADAARSARGAAQTLLESARTSSGSA